MANAKLRIVDSETGEVLPFCPKCQDFEDQLAGVEKEIRAWRSRYAALRRDKEAEAHSHGLWGLAIAVFMEWKIATNHMLSRWSADRFFLCVPYLEQDGYEMCRLAVWGIAAHPNSKRITKSYTERYDDFELVFRNRATFERYANRGAAVFGSYLPQPAPRKGKLK